MKLDQIDSLDWDKQGGLLPAVVQDAHTLRVLMVGYVNRDALTLTLFSRKVTFWSRSKQRLWTKGETSGNLLRVVGVETDCDGDALLIRAHPLGPTCHLDRCSCFADAPGSFFAELDGLIADRERDRPSGSYTTQLFEAGIRKIAQKVGEEGVETALAAIGEDDAALLGEAGDLLYHTLVLLRARGLGADDLLRTLAARHKVRTEAATVAT